MSPAFDRSLLPTSSRIADRPARQADERLPVPQALMIIVVLAALCWSVIAAAAAWLIG